MIATPSTVGSQTGRRSHPEIAGAEPERWRSCRRAVRPAKIVIDLRLWRRPRRPARLAILGIRDVDRPIEEVGTHRNIGAGRLQQLAVDRRRRVLSGIPGILIGGRSCGRRGPFARRHPRRRARLRRYIGRW